MCADTSNIVSVISGRNRNHMKLKFGGIDNLIIAAESGFYYGWNKYGKKLVYHKLKELRDWEWKESVLEIMKSYQERADGSLVTIKDSSVRWYYKDVDADFALKESNELATHLGTIFEYLPLDIVHEKDYVGVKPIGVDKGGYTKELLKFVFQRKGIPDFILCIGDSQNDEEMFKEINKFAKIHSIESKVYCITLEQRMSEAKYYLNNYTEVISTLEYITLPSSRVYSMFIYS
jgi:trehalose 6-phosphate synthase/phosphatase